MKYRYFINGEERKPTPEEIRKLNDVALRAVGYEPVKKEKKKEANQEA